MRYKLTPDAESFDLGFNSQHLLRLWWYFKDLSWKLPLSPFALACVSFAQTRQKPSYVGYLCYWEPEEGNRAVRSDKICGRIGKSNTSFKSHITDCSAFVYVAAERSMAREMKWGGRFPPTAFTSV